MEFLAELALLEGSFVDVAYWYIGLTDLGREGAFVWIHNGLDLEDEMWANNRPRNKSGNSEDCVTMVLNHDQVFWEDHRLGLEF